MENYLGCYIALEGPDFYYGIIKKAIEINANCFMFYAGSPQTYKKPPISLLKIKEGLELIKKNNINKNKIVIHASYLINIANCINKNVYESSKIALKNEIKMAKEFQINTIVLHPGCAVGGNKKKSIELLISTLNEILDNDENNIKIALETMAGKGSELGSTFEELKEIINGINKKNNIGVCLDTCHIFDAGYDLNDVNKIIQQFDKIIGLKKLFVIHINDSKNNCGSHKDRHENIGLGKIGFNNIYKIIHHKKLASIPKILETPETKEINYKKEIAMLKTTISQSS
ncbi:MAG: deoxyribonuclease IV [Bacilli bacterium]|nr:deoxyribonuclease IV [Bacilli bacterium]